MESPSWVIFFDQKKFFHIQEATMKQNRQDKCLFAKECPHYKGDSCTSGAFIYCTERAKFQEGYGTPKARMVFLVTSEIPAA